MKMPPEYIEAQKNMQPGVISSMGFLGEDSRNLADIIQTDENLMARFNLSFEEVSRWMKEMMNEALKGLGESVIVRNKWEVQLYEVRGFIPCPFKDGIFRKRVVVIKKIGSNLQLTLSDLSIHLFEKHHFLQGRGSFFRIEPQILKELLS